MCVTLNNGVKHAPEQEQEEEMIDRQKWARAVRNDTRSLTSTSWSQRQSKVQIILLVFLPEEYFMIINWGKLIGEVWLICTHQLWMPISNAQAHRTQTTDWVSVYDLYVILRSMIQLCSCRQILFSLDLRGQGQLHNSSPVVGGD